jgi:hypothetical protein
MEFITGIFIFLALVLAGVFWGEILGFFKMLLQKIR